MSAVSVILPTRDRPALLARAAASVLAQTHAAFELLIVDNNAATPPLDPAAAAFLADPRVRLLRRPDVANAAQARNAGLEAATGEWIAYLDDDDTCIPDKLARHLAGALAHDSPLALCGAEIVLNGRTHPVQCAGDLFAGDALLNEARWSTPLLLHRRHPSVRFDPALSAGEDAAFAHELLAAWDLRQIPNVAEPLVRMHQEGAPRARTNLRGRESWAAARRLWWRHGPRFTAQARRVFVLRSLVSREKLLGRPGQCLRYSVALLRAGGRPQLRFVANALLVARGLGRGRLVT